MEIKTRSRTELKSYFVKNSIPTESNFAELIDGVLNFKEDGLVKLPKNPLMIEAGGDAVGAKETIHFYRDFGQPKPDWRLSLNSSGAFGPGGAPRPGFNLSDGDGNSRLFIDRATGNLGIGTNSPTDKLEVAGRARIYLDRGVTTGELFGTGSPQKDLHFYDAVTSITDEAALGFVRGSHVNSPVLYMYDYGSSVDNVISFGRLAYQKNPATDYQPLMTIKSNGNVGIGTTSPSNQLHVKIPDGPLDFNQAIRVQTNEGDHSANRGGGIITQNYDVVTAGIFGLRETSSWQGALAFYTHTAAPGNIFGSTFTEKMRINSAGNVGIGTNSPATRFHIFMDNPELRIEHKTGNNNNPGGATLRLIGAGDNTNKVKLIMHGLVIESASGGGGEYLKFSNSTGDLMYLADNGNLGIGTNSPTDKLEIAGRARIYLDRGETKGELFGTGTSSLDLPHFYDAVTSMTTEAALGFVRGGHVNSPVLYMYDHNSVDNVISFGKLAFQKNPATAYRPLMTIKNNGNVGIGTTSPAAKLTVYGDLIRRVAVATGLGPVDETDNGRIMSRVLSFTKLYPDTAIRILYCDNLRVTGNEVAARWEIRVNGSPPPGGAIYQDKYGSSGNYHEPTTIMGYATGLNAGAYQIEVWVTSVPAHTPANAYTGWRDSRWTLEAQEVLIK